MTYGKVFLLSVLFGVLAAASAHADPGEPAWFARDVQRRAAWLPEDVKRLGVDAVYQRRMASFPRDVQSILREMTIPSWLIALVPSAPDRQPEILKQFRFMAELAGNPPESAVAQRAEQLLIFGGAAQLPTPGDAQSGASLGAEGCTAAMARYVLAELKLEFPPQLATMPDRLTTSQSSIEMKALFVQAANNGAPWLELKRRPFAALKTEDVEPGSLMIAQKPGGTHVFGWTRVPDGWRWSVGDKMAIGNTGLAQFGDRMILAQEYLTDDPSQSGELEHNEHGPINSDNVIYSNGRPVLEDPRTNVYAAQGSDFIMINLR